MKVKLLLVILSAFNISFVQTTMLGLLGYSSQNPAPKELKLYSIYRYIIEEKGRLVNSSVWLIKMKLKLTLLSVSILKCVVKTKRIREKVPVEARIGI